MNNYKNYKSFLKFKSSGFKKSTKYKSKSLFLKFCAFFLKRKKNLNIKILNFFFNIILLFLESSKSSFDLVNDYRFNRNYQILFLFLKFFFLVLNFLNHNFNINSEKFFSSKQYLFSFYYYYKFFLLIIFLGKKAINLNFKNLVLNLYFNYLLFSIYFFLNSFLVLLKDIELKKKKKKAKSYDNIIYSNIILKTFKISHFFYKNYIFKSSNLIQLKKKDSNTFIHLLCSNWFNKGVLDDNKFSKILSIQRQFFRLVKENVKSLVLFNHIIKKARPLYKVVYQRRGRIFIPIMTYFFYSKIRDSLSIKSVFNNSYTVSGIYPNSIENKITISLLDMYFSDKDDKYLFQPDIKMSVRKESLGKGYFFKVMKVRSN